MSNTLKKVLKKCKDCGEEVDKQAEQAFYEGLVRPENKEIKKHLYCKRV